MSILSEGTFLVAIVNLASLVGNIYYYSNISKTKGTTDVINALNAQLQAKDLLLKEAQKDVENIERQYEALVVEKQKLATEVKTYQRFHGHKPEL